MRDGLRYEITVEATSTGCWLLPHKPRTDGYVRVSVFGRVQYAHRYVYNTLVKTLPTTLELDHTCRNRARVNPDHLEPVTHKENCKRGIPRCAKLTHCKRGHALAGDNLLSTKAYAYRNGKAQRRCRICANEYAREWNKRKYHALKEPA